MRLIASLTTVSAAALLVATLSGCAGGAPKRPTAAQDKSDRFSSLDRCSDLEARGATPTADCPDTTPQQRRRRVRPGLENDPAQQLPGMPGLELPGTGSVLGR